jgi:biotin synthase
MVVTLANLPTHPESVPINMLVAVEGTPFAENEPVDAIDFVRVVAVARIMMPASIVRFAAGRLETSDAVQALAVFAGANSVFYGEKLLTTPNPGESDDARLFAKLGLRPMSSPA